MTDPYKVLGISQNATDDEVKKAYRKLAKRYHPDIYVNNPLSDLAAEKMKEINTAHDTITRQRANGSGSSGSGTSGSGTSGSGSSGSDNGFNGNATGGSDTYTRIRQLIFGNRIGEAEVLLQRTTVEERNAEWHFLMGHVLYKKGWLQDARSEMETACRLDPYNAEYRTALDRMSVGFSQSPYARNTRAGGCSGCDVCSSLICADCCCECMGGDLIGCC